MLKTNLLENFPQGRTPRENQYKLLEKIQQGLATDKKFICVNAPTGSGKSMLAATLCNASTPPNERIQKWVNTYQYWNENNIDTILDEIDTNGRWGCAVLTATKNLQDQYTNDFKDLQLLKGKNNYQCNYDPEYAVDEAPCITAKTLKKECWACNRCDYYNNRNHSIINKFAVYNYDVYLNLPLQARQRQILVCDEASELENILVSFFSLDINYETIEKLLEVKDYPRLNSEEEVDGHLWLKRLGGELEDRMEMLKEDLQITKDRKKIAFKLKTVTQRYMEVKRVLNNWGRNGENKNSVEYIVELIEPDKFNKNIKSGVTFTPFRVNKLAKYLFETVDKVVFLSATIIDHQKEMMDLGIQREDYVYIESPSLFDPKKSPIKISAKYPLSYTLMDKNLPKVIQLADAILNKHKDEKGLIHTVSFKITQAVERDIKNKRLIFREAGKTNEVLLEEHSNTNKPTVMVSPSMSHGVDLKGDLGRFQIIMKVPYLPLSNKRIKRLSKEDYRWYVNKTLAIIVQMAGRCTRNETDESVTYIVDGSVKRLFEQNWDKLPLYFRDRLV